MRADAEARDVRFARPNTTRKMKFTLPGPMTMVDTLADDHYKNREKLAFALAELLNTEVLELAALGVSLDGPALDRLALRYVEKFATSTGKLTQYLQRKLRERGWAALAPGLSRASVSE